MSNFAMNNSQAAPKKKGIQISTNKIVYLGVLSALSAILFSALFTFYPTPTLKITLGNVPILIAGLAYGPLAGGIVGFIGDFLGVLMNTGGAWNPLLGAGSILFGIIPGLLSLLFQKKCQHDNRKLIGLIVVADVVANIVVAWVFKTIVLHFLYGTPYAALIPSRLLLSCILTVLESTIVCLLFRYRVLNLFGYVRNAE